VQLLAREGITKGVHNVGDVMFDSVLAHLERSKQRMKLDALFGSLGFDPKGGYALATVHRPENTDHPARLGGILEALSSLGMPVLLPVHPRTRKVIHNDMQLFHKVADNVWRVDPLGYLELLLVASNAAVILTDSGGLQKEAFFLGVRCVTLRDETEWVETVEAGANEVVGADATKIVEATTRAIAKGRLPPGGAGPFGDGHAAEKIVERLEKGA
jgi:UDP-N-acetylglucosamine 2-epimerase